VDMDSSVAWPPLEPERVPKSEELPPLDDAWAAPELDIDKNALLERGESLTIDHDIKVLARANRLALHRDPFSRHPANEDTGGMDIVEVPLYCVAHAHPDCRFRWVRITLDLGSNEGVVIQDMSPRDEVADHPVKITTTYHGGLSFTIASVPLAPEVSVERSMERDVYFPTVTVSGAKLTHAIWDFTAIAGGPLHVNRDLRLLVGVPSSLAEIEVGLTLRAAVVAAGVTGVIPLIGRHTVKIEKADTLKAQPKPPPAAP
jgi:hypothetical protein